LIAAGTSLQEMTAILASEFEVAEETLTTDLERLVSDLAETGLVTVDGAHAPAGRG
jgi:hypothetical protein